MCAVNHKPNLGRLRLLAVGLLATLVLASCQPVRPVSQLLVENEGRAGAVKPSAPPDESNHEEAHTYYNEGIALYESGDFEQAITRFDKAIEIDPNMAEIYVGRGIANFHRTFSNTTMTHFDEAKPDFDRAIELNPGLAEAYYHRGTTYMAAIGSFFLWFPVFVEQAKEDFEMYLELAPRGLNRDDAADMLEILDDIDVEELRQGTEQQIARATSDIEQNPNDIDVYAYRERAIYYASVGQNDVAMQDIKLLMEVGAAANTLTQEQLEYFESFTDNSFDLWSLIFLAPGISE